MSDLRDFSCNVCNDPAGADHDHPKDCIAYLKKAKKEMRDKVVLERDLRVEVEEREGVLRKDAIEFAGFMKKHFVTIQDFERAKGCENWIEHFTLEEETVPPDNRKTARRETQPPAHVRGTALAQEQRSAAERRATMLSCREHRNNDGDPNCGFCRDHANEARKVEELQIAARNLSIEMAFCIEQLQAQGRGTTGLERRKRELDELLPPKE